MAKKKIRKKGKVAKKPGPELSIALSKGALFNGALALFQQIGIRVNAPSTEDRELSFTDRDRRFRFLIVRPADVPVYVEQGAVDIGIAGKDVLEEGGNRVAEMLDLQFGGCQLVLAVPQVSRISSAQELPSGSRVATKFTRLTEKYFSRLEKPVEIVKLYGSVELAPSTHLADAITDLTASGKTLRKLGLKVVDVIMESSARLIANPVRLKVKYKEIWELCSELSAKGISKKKFKK